MRLMARDVVVAQAEREIDRIDVFERRSEKRKMREEPWLDPRLWPGSNCSTRLTLNPE